MSKYFSQTVLNEIVDAVEKIKSIRNDIYQKYKVDILDNDAVSLSSFVNIVQSIDPNYNCNFSRNGEDGYTLIDNKRVEIESKTTKVVKTRKKDYKKTTFAFHANGLIDHQTYLFNLWDKDTLLPVRCYYVKDPINVDKINKLLRNLSENWKKKPPTRGGYDVIHLSEDVLINMIKETHEVNNCKVYSL